MRVFTAFLIAAVLVLAVIAGYTGKNMAYTEQKNGTDSHKEGWKTPPAAGILYTTSSHGGSCVTWVDDDLEEVDESRYSFSAAYYDGYRNMCGQDGKVYLYPRGDYERKDNTKLQMIDMADGSAQEIECGRSNVTGYDADGDITACSSNENNICYLDIFNTKTGEHQSMKTEDVTVFDIILAGDLVYGMALDKELKVWLMSFDISRSAQEKLAELPDHDTPGFLQLYDGKILFISDNRLCAYDIEAGSLNRTELTRQGAFNLNLEGANLFIAYTDVFSDGEGDSLIEVRDASDMHVITQETVPGSVFQMEVSGDEIWLLGREKLARYTWSDKGLTNRKEKDIKKEGYDVGGFMIPKFLYGSMTEEDALSLNEKLIEQADQMRVVPDQD